MILKGASGKSYQLAEKPFSSGGEGDIYGITSMPGGVVKVYHADRVTQELEEKLLVMYRHPPSREIFAQIAWPVDVVYDTNGAFRGFVMLRLNITHELSAIYAYPPKKNISYKAKIIIAQNICAVISEIHKAGFVFGDFNPKNIGIDLNTCRVAFLDTDSYHIVDGSHTYRCNVCLDGYVAPELLKKCEPYKTDAYAQAPLPTFTQETDNFALAIHIFRLLMNGYTPFNGIRESENASTASPGTGNQAIKRDSYCFKPGNKPQSVAVPPLSALPGEIADLFARAFMYGRVAPAQRPTAAEWHTALLNYENSLVNCPNNSAHMYQKGLQSCPWCEADGRYAAATAAPSMGPQRGPSLPQKTFSGAVVHVAPPPAPPSALPPVRTSGSAASPSRAAAPPSPVFSSPAVPAPPPAASAVTSAKRRTGAARKAARRKKILISLTLIALAAILGGAIINILSAVRYNAAEELLMAGDYDGAALAFQKLGSYQNSAERAFEAHYAKAELLLAAGDYDGAVAVFQKLEDYRNSPERIAKARYAKAEALLAAGDLRSAALSFGKAGGYADAKERSFAAWNEVAVRNTISSGNEHAAGLRADGTVVATGTNGAGQCDVDDWSNIVAVSTGVSHTVGLKSNGTVVATGANDNGQCDVDSWTDFVAVAAGSFHTVGLRIDGTVVATGTDRQGQCSNVDTWTDIVAVEANHQRSIGLKADGTVVATAKGAGQRDIDDWTDIAAISTIFSNDLLGLKADGTVMVAGWSVYSSSVPESWTDIVEVSVGGDHIVGLKSDGTVLAVGYGARKELKEWTNIVAVSAGTHFTIGLKSNGTVVVDSAEAIGMEETWTNIKLPGGQ